jgi:protein-S-isoprenylcysteine O-methyltransferase Ste14
MIAPISDTYTIATWMWAAMGVYWLASALQTKKTESGERSWLRFGRLAILVVVFDLLLSRSLAVGWLGNRFVSAMEPWKWTGITLTAAGLGLCLWARRELADNWSDKVGLKVDHELIRTGPYKFLRHPIYSGVLLGMAGTALAIGEWKGVVAFTVMAVNYAIKARREERILVSKFGQAYEEYKRRAGFLVPGW